MSPLINRVRKLLRLPDPFRARHFALQEQFADDYRQVAASLLRALSFESAVDIGCANGLLLRELQRAGKAVDGIELSPEVGSFLPRELRDCVQIGDFSVLRGSWDLACCMEVAEHIEPRRSDELVATVSAAASRWIYFTAAPPGQGGHGHINCRPMEDWLERFQSRGWCLAKQETESFRRSIADLEKAVWLPANSVILEPGSP